MLAWLAVFALAMLPSLTRVVNATVHNGWVEICSAQGMRWVAPDGTLSERGPGGQRAEHGQHCPLCGGAGVAALPATAATVLPAAFDADVVAPLFLHAPRPLLAWSFAQPRAPPHAA
jgi:Protein of unknown function (DUF2946)